MNLALSTIHGYNRTLADFFVYLYKQDKSYCIENVTTENILEYLASLRRRISPVSVRDYYRVLRVFFRYLYSSRYITVNPIAVIKQPKVSKKIIPSFTNKEIQRILDCYDKNTFLGFRNYVIMVTFFSTGIRKTELQRLKMSDVILDADYIVINGKGSKQRHIPISPVFKRIIEKYLKKRKEHLREQQALECHSFFITSKGTALGTGALDRLFYNLKETLKGSTTRVSAHTWRHTFAKTFLLNGGDIFTLQRLLGHEDVTTTRVYIDLNASELKVQNDRYNPLDNTRWLYY